MMIQEAFKIAQEIFPYDKSLTLSVEVTQRVGRPPQTIRWIHSNLLNQKCISSYRSWEHALAIAKSGNEEIWPEVDESSIEDEEPANELV